MTPFKKCPVCSGDIVEKQVEKLLHSNGHSIAIHVTADVCQQCGERFFSEDVIHSFEEIRNKLNQQDFSEFISTGQSFTVNESWHNNAIQPVK